MDKIGEQGEKFVAQCLENKGWTILHHRWSCRWGEIDLIAQDNQGGVTYGDRHLAFIEVKTRNSRNWDENGLLAITPRKQVKLSKAAASFLSKYTHLADHPCRFDVALVIYTPKLKQPGYQFTLQQYIQSAWDNMIE